MYFGLMVGLTFVGMFFLSLCGILGGYIPASFKIICLFMGVILPFMGMMVLYSRCLKTGVMNLINPGGSGKITWFYIYGDGELRILPAIRKGEGFLQSADLDVIVPDMRTYSLCEHKIRLVPEELGHAIDSDYVLYTQFLKTKYGFTNLREARAGVFGKLLDLVKPKETPAEEKLLVRGVDE